MGNHMSCISLAAAAASEEAAKFHPNRLTMAISSTTTTSRSNHHIEVWKLLHHRLPPITSTTSGPGPSSSDGHPAAAAAEAAEAIELVALTVDEDGPIRAGDLMVENPGHFLCLVSRDSLGLSPNLDGDGDGDGDDAPPPTPPALVAAVPADQELHSCSAGHHYRDSSYYSSSRLRHVYLLLPMSRLRTRFSHAEIHRLRRAFLESNHDQRRRRSRSRLASQPATSFLIISGSGGNVAHPLGGDSIDINPPSVTTAPPQHHHDAETDDEGNGGDATAAEDAEDRGSGASSGGNHDNYIAGRMQHYSRSRSWIPRLETITEMSAPLPENSSHKSNDSIQHYSSFSHRRRPNNYYWAPGHLLATVKG